MPDLAPKKTRDGRLGYEATGDPALPPLVFLHGIGGAARAWRGQLDFFGDRFHAIAWDMPGYGGSAPLAKCSIAALADALRDFLQQVGAAKPILVGHSIGGMVVQQLLAKNPHIASAVVLAQTSPAFGKPDGDWQKAFIEARLGPLDRGETLASLAPSLVKELVGDDPDAGGMVVQQLLAKSPHIAGAVVLAQTSPAFGKPDGDWQKAFIEARLGPLDRGETLVSLAPSLVKELVGDDPDVGGMELARDCMASVPEATYRATMLALMGFDLRGALKDIAAPTLVLSGSRDKNAPAPMMAKMASYIPYATYVELEGVGHLVNLERPATFNATLDQFLKANVAATQVTA